MFLSKTIFFNIESAIKSILDNTFTERDIKLLLVELRELCRYHIIEIKKISAPMTLKNSMDENFLKILEDFAEVCDFIFHNNRKRGIIEKNIRKYIDKLNDNIEANSTEPNPTIESFININSVIMCLLVMITIYLDKYNSKFDIKIIEKIIKEKINDIALCIMSLLQDHVIKLDKESGLAVLEFYTYENKYRLYCRVFNSIIEQNTKKRVAGGKGQIQIGFPVVISQIETIDNTIESLDGIGMVYTPPEFGIIIPSPVETYRDSNNNLRFKKVQRYDPKGFPLRIFKSATKEIYDLLVNNFFTERNIKELMIDLREYAKYLRNLPNNTSRPKPKNHNRYLNAFIEICDCVAHVNRSQGVLEKVIRINIEALKRINSKRELNMIIESIFDINSAISGLIIVLQSYISIYGINTKEDDNNKIINSYNDISLCIISLLQNCFIKPKDNYFQTFLYIDCIDNKYCLSARVKFSESISDCQEVNLQNYNISIIKTNACNIDGLLFNQLNSCPRCIETYRDDSGILRTRFLD